MPPRKYSSDTRTEQDADEIVSTEGIAFELDEVEFTCHGQLDGNDMMDLAVPMADAADGWYDPEALAAAGRFYKQVMGEDTYRAFSAHRRRKRTPPSVVAQIMMDLIQEITSLPPDKRSASPAGLPATRPSSGAASSSRAVTVVPKVAVDPEGIIPPEMAAAAEVVIVPAAAAGATPAEDPMAGKHRTVNLGDPSRTKVEPAAT